MLEQCQEVVAELVGLDGGYPDAKVAVDIEDVFYKLLKVGALVLIAPQVDACQYDFLETVGDDFAHIVINVGCGSA